MLHRPDDYCQPFIVKRDPVVGRFFLFPPFTIIYDFKYAIRCLDQSCQVHSGQQGHPSLPTDLKRGSSSPWALHKNNSRLSFLLRQGDGSSLMVVRTYIGCPWSEGFTPRQSCCVFVMGNRLVIGYIPMQAL